MNLIWIRLIVSDIIVKQNPFTLKGKLKRQTWIFTLERDIWVFDCLWNWLLDTLSVPFTTTTNSPSGTASTVTRISPLSIWVSTPLLTFSEPETFARPTCSAVIEDGPLLPITVSISVADWPGFSDLRRKESRCEEKQTENKILLKIKIKYYYKSFKNLAELSKVPVVMYSHISPLDDALVIQKRHIN